LGVKADMNKSAKKKNLVSIVLTVLVIALYLVPNFASALTVGISDIADTNKGNDVEFDVTVDIQNPDKFVPISQTNLTIEYTGVGNHTDKFECNIQVNGDFECFRTKGNHKTEFTDIEITATKDSSLGYGYGYGYSNGINFGYGYGYGYGYGTPSPQFGKITYHVLWHTPVNLHPGQYTAAAKLTAKDSVFSSAPETFEALTPANPQNSDLFELEIGADELEFVEGNNEHTTIIIDTGSAVNGTVTVEEYSSNPTANTNFGVLGVGRFIAIEADSSIDNALTEAIINVSYTQGEVESAGIDESTLRLYYYNGTSNTWTPFNPPNGGVDTTDNYVWARTNHFSIWGIFGSAASSPSPSPSAAASVSSGGGGSGYYWECSGWSECSPQGIQTRACSLVVSSQGSVTKPEETRSCTYTSPTTQEAPTTPAAPTTPTPTPAATPSARAAPKGLAALTGAVISGLTEPSGIAAIIVSVLVLGGGYTAYYYLYKKKR